MKWWIKVASWLTGSSLGLGLLLMSAAPCIVSTPWGTQYLTAWLNRGMAGSVSIQQLKLGWFSNQELVGLSLRDLAGLEILSVKQVNAKVSFFRLLRTFPYVCSMHVDGLQAVIIQNSDGTTNLQQALSFTKNASKTIQKNPSSGTYGANIESRSPRLASLSLQNVQATVRSASYNGPLTVDISGSSATSETSGSFALKARLSGFNSADELPLKLGLNGYLTVDPGAQMYVKLDLNRLPTVTLDYLAAMGFPKVQGSFTEALGSNLDLNFEQTIDSKTMTVDLQARSPTLDAKLNARWADGVLSLAQPGKIDLTITPAFASSLYPSIKLLKATQAHVLLDRMNPTKGAETPSVRLKILVDDLQIDGGPALGLVDFKNVQGALEHIETSQSMLASLDAALHYHGSQGTLRVQGAFATKDKQPKADYVIAAKQFPSLLIDRVLQANGWFSDLVGERFDGQFTHVTQARGTKIKLEFDSEGLSVPTLSLLQSDGFLTAEPDAIHLRLTPLFARRFLAAESGVKVQSGASATLYLKHLCSSMADNATFSWADVKLEAGLAVAPITLETSQGAIILDAIKATLSGPSFADAQLDLQADLASEANSSLAQATIGRAASVHFLGALGTSKDGSQLLLKSGQLTWSSDLLAMQAAGSIDENGRLKLSQPLTGCYQVPPTFLVALGLTSASSPLLSSPVALNFKLEQLDLSLKDFWHQDLLMQLKTKADLIQLKGNPGEEPATLEEVTFALLFDSKQCKAALALAGYSSVLAAEKRPFDLDISVNGWCSHDKWDWAKLNVEAQGNLQQFPVRLISALTAKPDLLAFFGPTADFTLQLKRVAGEKIAQSPIQISLQAQGLKLDAAFSGGTVLTQGPRPVTLNLEMTLSKFGILKKAFSAAGWHGLERWTLTKDSAITVTTERLVLPFPEAGKSFGPASGSITVAFEPLVIKNSDDGTTLGWESLKALLASDKEEGAYLVTVEALEAPGQNGGTFSAAGTIKNAWASRWFDRQQMHIAAKINASHLSLDHLLHAVAPDAVWSKRMPGLLGETIALDSELVWSAQRGRLQAKILSPQSNVMLDGSWENGFLVFNRPIIVETQLTKRFIDEVLADFAPLLLSTVASEQSIRFEVDPHKTRIPLSGTSLKQLKISNAKLTIGKVLFRSDGQIGQLAALLRGELTPVGGTFPIIFTPLLFSVDKGFLTVQRTDALIADRYPVAVWGTVDLPRDKVNLVVGVTAQALQEAYNINISDDRYMLQLPLRGTLANASIDKLKATTRITSLVAQSHGGSNGLLLGSVLDLLDRGDDQKVPPPLEPLPWAQIPAQPQDTEKEDSAQKKEPAAKKIQSHLQKGASKLLKILK